MKTFNSNISTFSVVSTIVFSSLIMDSTAVHAEQEMLNEAQQLCQVSQRGTRCKQADNTFPFISDTSEMSVSVCSRSTRGHRCKEFRGYLLVADIAGLLRQSDVKKCVDSNRGLRCKAS